MLFFCWASYVGCYNDIFNRVFNHHEHIVNNELWTPQSCIDVCAGFARAGVEYFGRECWCGLENENPEKYGSSAQCSEGIGGEWSIDVYDVPQGKQLGDEFWF